MGKTNDFFIGKRDWSRIKDNILRDYIIPYVAKVNALGRPIVLIDGFAGPGIFEDGTVGSPLIICDAAERLAKGNYHAILINKQKKYHETLSHEIVQRGWEKSVEALRGDSQVELQKFPRSFKNETVFLYLDPFGPKDCDFTLIRPFLQRSPSFSTEILLTMNMPGMPRLAARNAVNKGRQEEEGIKKNHQLLTRVFGGDYWWDILIQQDKSPEERELLLIEAYRDKIAHYLPFADFCPVREYSGGRVKYFIVCASHHPHALSIFNDTMLKAYYEGMHKADFTGGLWINTNWQEWRSIEELDDIVINMVKIYPGATRENIWLKIVQKYFMKYL